MMETIKSAAPNSPAGLLNPNQSEQGDIFSSMLTAMIGEMPDDALTGTAYQMPVQSAERKPGFETLSHESSDLEAMYDVLPAQMMSLTALNETASVQGVDDYLPQEQPVKIDTVSTGATLSEAERSFAQMPFVNSDTQSGFGRDGFDSAVAQQQIDLGSAEAQPFGGLDAVDTSSGMPVDSLESVQTSHNAISSSSAFVTETQADPTADQPEQYQSLFSLLKPQEQGLARSAPKTLTGAKNQMSGITGLANAPDMAATVSQSEALEIDSTSALGGPGQYLEGQADFAHRVAEQQDAELFSLDGSHAEDPGMILGETSTEIASSSEAVQTEPPKPQFPRYLAAAAIAQIGWSVTEQVVDGAQEYKVNLNPEELGAVEIAMEISGDQIRQISVRVENPETLELLKKDIQKLESLLTNQGFSLEDRVRLESGEQSQSSESQLVEEQGASFRQATGSDSQAVIGEEQMLTSGQSILNLRI